MIKTCEYTLLRRKTYAAFRFVSLSFPSPSVSSPILHTFPYLTLHLFRTEKEVEARLKREGRIEFWNQMWFKSKINQRQKKGSRKGSSHFLGNEIRFLTTNYISLFLSLTSLNFIFVILLHFIQRTKCKLDGRL